MHNTLKDKGCRMVFVYKGCRIATPLTLMVYVYSSQISRLLQKVRLTIHFPCSCIGTLCFFFEVRGVDGIRNAKIWKLRGYSSPAENGWVENRSFPLKNASFCRCNLLFVSRGLHQLFDFVYPWTLAPLPRILLTTRNKTKYISTMGLVTSAVGVWWRFFLTLSWSKGIRYVKGKQSRSHILCAHCVPRDSYKPASIEYILDLTPPPSYCGNCWFIRIPYSKYVTILVVPVAGWRGRTKVHLHLGIFEVEVYEEEMQQKTTRKWPKKLSRQRKGPCWKEMNHQSTEIWPICFFRRLAAWHLKNEKGMMQVPSFTDFCMFFLYCCWWLKSENAALPEMYKTRWLG